ncbi:MAG TPA: hypothetical protein EYP88_03650 [Anaerolineales bacterium]|nr:hypothetical protein [Anaerolineales bacterium]
MQEERKKPSILSMVVISIVIFFSIAFLIISMNTGDILWFVQTFEETPQRIVVHCYGKKITLEPETPEFAAVNDAINRALTGEKRWDELSMSNATYVEYQTSPGVFVVEIAYDPPGSFHSPYKFFKQFDLLIIPLDGRHAAVQTVFGRMRGNMIPGSMHPESNAAIATALSTQDVCHIR